MVRLGQVDFGDQIVEALRLFRSRPHVLRRYQERFKHILVDEFQDTNFAQNQLVQLLAAKHGNLTVVADDDQSIYKWRGAALSNVMAFKEQYAGARDIVLTENYRCPQAVLDSAYRLIQYNNPDRLEVKYGISKRLTRVGADDAADRDPGAPRLRHGVERVRPGGRDDRGGAARRAGPTGTSPSSCGPTTTPTRSCGRSTCAASRGPSRAMPGSTAGPRSGS